LSDERQFDLGIQRSRGAQRRNTIAFISIGRTGDASFLSLRELLDPNTSQRAVHEVIVNTVLVGLPGLVGQLFGEDNAHKVRRGQAGRIGQGLTMQVGRPMAMLLPSAKRASGSLSKLKLKSSGVFSRNTLLEGHLVKSHTIVSASLIARLTGSLTR
jgi:hypothetical protein